MSNEKRFNKMIDLKFLLAWVLGFGLMFGIMGCGDDDDDRIISVCNGDNTEYLVKLHRDSDGVVIDEFYLEEWYDSDRCDTFNDPREGRYYLTIWENAGSVLNDTSRDFYLDDDDYHTFRIDSTGTIDD